LATIHGAQFLSRLRSHDGSYNIDYKNVSKFVEVMQRKLYTVFLFTVYFYVCYGQCCL